MDIEKVLPHVECEHELKPARNPPEATIFDYIPFLRLFRWIARSVSKRARARQLAAGIKPKRNIYEDVVESYVPLEILLFISEYYLPSSLAFLLADLLSQYDSVTPRVSVNNLFLFMRYLTIPLSLHEERICHTCYRHRNDKQSHHASGHGI